MFTLFILMRNIFIATSRNGNRRVSSHGAAD
jgi:hypothetical protein